MKFRFLGGLCGAALLAPLLAGCGGGGGGGNDSGVNESGASTGALQAAKGAYQGTLSDSDLKLLLLDDNGFWGLYGDDTASGFVVRGFIQGQGQSQDDNFGVTDARDFGTVPATPATVAGVITPGTQIRGLVGFPTATVSFGAALLNASNSTFDFNRAALVSDVVGSWSLTGLDGNSADLTIDPAGQLQASSAGCTMAGTAIPSISNNNLLDIDLTTGPAPCASPGTHFHGIAIDYLLPGSSTRQLILAAMDPARTTGTVFFGTR